MERYLARVYDAVLAFRLQAKGAVLIEGPKWCGKTTTAEQAAKSSLYLQDPSTRQQNLQLAKLAPGKLLEGETPRLIDEWQEAPQLWDAIRFEIDRRDEFSQFILTGSTVPPSLKNLQHTGTGRISRLRMRPMSLFESLDSTGEASLQALFEGETPIAQGDDDIDELAFLVCRGGWPKAVGCEERVALQQASDYLDAVAEIDISAIDGVQRNPHNARALMRSYARMTSSQGSLSSMLADLNSSGIAMSQGTMIDYVEALRKLFVIEDLPAWNPKLRSKMAIRTSPTRHFVDPSIAVAALGTNPSELIGDLETFGLLFESMCIRDLRAYADALDGEVLHYRDKSGLECDAVVRLRNGSYGLVEVKLGGDDAIDKGAKSLLRLAKVIDTDAMPTPSFLMVLTGVGSCSYPRDDGVMVVPVRTLGP